MQTSLKTAVSFPGVGLHSGRPVRMSVHPAPADHGIRFQRSDVTGKDPVVVANWQFLSETALCTQLVNADGVSVATVEHVMAALAGCGIHNALITLDGPEVPILDGSAAPFVAKFLRAGVVRSDAPLTVLQVLRPVEVQAGEARARLEPATHLEIDFTIEFDEPAIGHQHKHLVMKNGAFLRMLAASRTFCRLSDIDTMRAAGLALGGTLDNALVFDGDTVLNPDGLRFPDEAVRHKMLDALGDLYAAGMPILGRYTGVRSGHALTARLLRALFADEANFALVTCSEEMAKTLPGTGLVAADLALSA